MKHNFTLENILASACIYKVRNEFYILHPLNMQEWSFIFSSMEDNAEYITAEVAFYAIWLSIKKEDQHMKRAELVRELGKKHETIIKLFEKIKDISWPALDEKEKTETEKKEQTADDLAFVCVFAEHYGWDISIVSKMTPFQLHFYLDKLESDNNTGQKKQGTKVKSLGEARELFLQKQLLLRMK